MIINTDALRAILAKDLDHAKMRSKEHYLLGHDAVSMSYNDDIRNITDMIASIKKMEHLLVCLRRPNDAYHQCHIDTSERGTA